jgi:hypothetical protein
VWQRLLALALGLLLALALDQTIRLALPPEPEAAGRPWYLQTVQYHPILGWSGYPNYAETNDGIRIETNSLGYRDREPVEADDRALRVLFLGDSFTWGDEVHAEDRFTAVLEASCGLECDRLPPVHAINQGIIAYGTAQSFLQYLLTRRQQRADIVVLGLFTGNDLGDNSSVDSRSGPRPRLIDCDQESDGRDLCLEGVPVPPAVDWPEHRLVNPRGRVASTLGWSGLVTLASRRRAPQSLIEMRSADLLEEMAGALPFPIVERISDEPIENRIGQLDVILAAMDRAIREDGRRFGVLVFPSAKVYAGDAGDEPRDYLEVVGVLDRLDIPFADYYERTKDIPWERLFSGRLGHWTPSGHREAAALLRPLLVSLTASGTPAPPQP